MNIITRLFEWLSNIIDQGIGVAVVAAFIWGMLSILLSPCHLASIPLIIGYINKDKVQEAGEAFMKSLLFSFGILSTIAVIGFVTSGLGRLIGDIGTAGNYIVAGIFFLSGLYLLEVLNPAFSLVNIKQVKVTGGRMAFMLGLIFGLALGPCTFAFMAPVLVASFHYAANNIMFSVLIMLAFALGHCLVISGAAATGSRIMSYLKWTQESAGFKFAKKLCGILVILGGIYFVMLTF